MDAFEKTCLEKIAAFRRQPAEYEWQRLFPNATSAESAIMHSMNRDFAVSAMGLDPNIKDDDLLSLLKQKANWRNEGVLSPGYKREVTMGPAKPEKPSGAPARRVGLGNINSISFATGFGGVQNAINAGWQYQKEHATNPVARAASTLGQITANPVDSTAVAIGGAALANAALTYPAIASSVWGTTNGVESGSVTQGIDATFDAYAALTLSKLGLKALDPKRLYRTFRARMAHKSPAKLYKAWLAAKGGPTSILNGKMMNFARVAAPALWLDRERLAEIKRRFPDAVSGARMIVSDKIDEANARLRAETLKENNTNLIEGMRNRRTDGTNYAAIGAGGAGGVLSYIISRAIFGGGSFWTRLLNTLVGAAGAYGAYKLVDNANAGQAKTS